MQLRTFENSDPPLLCEIWRSYRQMRGKLKSLSPAVLEKMILSKPYFDPQGLFLAWTTNAQSASLMPASGLQTTPLD